MTVVVINAISIKEGGSLVVLKQLLCAMVELRPEWHWHVATNGEASKSLVEMPGTTYHVFRDDEFSGWKVRMWYETTLPNLINQVNADLLFSQTNYLPARKLTCPALLLVQHAGHFSDRFKAMTEAQLGGFAARVSWRLKGRWIKSSVRQAQAVTVQTRALAVCIELETGIPAGRIHVIAHGTGQAVRAESLPPAPEPGQPYRIGYITKHGVQKNFVALFQAVAQLKAAGLRPVLVLTLASELSETRDALAVAEKLGILHCLENHGNLAGAELTQLYRSLHVFVFPSWCESFGFPMVEALAHGLPLLIAATESNIEVAGRSGLTFPPDDPQTLAALIKRLIKEPGWHQARSQASLERSRQFTWQKSATSTLALMDRMLKTLRNARHE